MIAITCQKDGLILLQPCDIKHFFCFDEDEYQITYSCPVCGQIKAQPISAGLAVLLQRDWGIKMYNVSDAPLAGEADPVTECYLAYFRKELDSIESVEDIEHFCIP